MVNSISVWKRNIARYYHLSIDGGRNQWPTERPSQDSNPPEQEASSEVAGPAEKKNEDPTMQSKKVAWFCTLNSCGLQFFGALEPELSAYWWQVCPRRIPYITQR